MGEDDKAQGPWALVVRQVFWAVEGDLSGDGDIAHLSRNMAKASIRNAMAKRGEPPHTGEDAAARVRRGGVGTGSHQGEGL